MEEILMVPLSQAWNLREEMARGRSAETLQAGGQDSLLEAVSGSSGLPNLSTLAMQRLRKLRGGLVTASRQLMVEPEPSREVPVKGVLQMTPEESALLVKRLHYRRISTTLPTGGQGAWLMGTGQATDVREREDGSYWDPPPCHTAVTAALLAEAGRGGAVQAAELG
ncbi:hypothetical protein P7K49_010900 [Saguinus oedipus]|uniref:Uncharacterized protein n=1 Tax=Saguinus oedipus TaxID=9490 RepID=A0ABQ9VP51_SAGOE|nr:hypothetical protein P7K49_010900 [Saguinus oedipus]